MGKTIASWDEKPTYTYKNTKEHGFGVLFFEFYYGKYMKDCIANAEEIAEYIDWSKSPGWPHTYLGFRTKEELVHAMACTSFYNKTSILPIHNISGKVEFLSLDAINEMKIRIFQIPPFELLHSQIKFGKRISLNIMNKHWSAYGFNPYGGGFDRLARKLLSKRYRGCYDVSGWDKFLPVLDDIYNVLKRQCEIPEHEQKEFDWMSRFTKEFLLRLPDGTVVLKPYGNASGSGVTTRDNIFGHIIIFAAGLYKAYVAEKGEEPPMELVAAQIVFLFGDDNVFSVDEEFRLICDTEFLGKHLQSYGLKLKFFYGGLDADLSVLSFLGAHFKKLNGNYLPCYDVERIATTMIYEKDRLTLDQHIQKAFTLMVMSYPTEHFETFKGAYSHLVRSSEVQRSDDPICQLHAFMGPPENHQIEAFYLGGEANCVTERFNFFSADTESITDVDSPTTILKYSHESYEPNDFAEHNHLKRVNEILNEEKPPKVVSFRPVARSRETDEPLIDFDSENPFYEQVVVRDFMSYLFLIKQKGQYGEFFEYFYRDGLWRQFDPNHVLYKQQRKRQFELFKIAHGMSHIALAMQPD